MYGFVYQVVEADPGTVFIVIEATVIYMGNATLDVSPADFSLTDSEDHQYSWYSHTSPERFPTTQLHPGKIAASGKIAFQVLETASGLEVSYLLDGTSPVLAGWKLAW